MKRTDPDRKSRLKVGARNGRSGEERAPHAGRLNRDQAPVSPTSDEVRERLVVVQAKHPRSVTVRTVGQTAQGRPIDATTVTDTSVPDTDKQNVLIVAGQHG